VSAVGRGPSSGDRPRSPGQQEEIPLDVVPLLQGIALGVSICASPGPQTVLVLRQGIQGEAALGVAAICTFSDFLLIAAAAVGADALLRLVPNAASIGAWGGATLCLAYGAFALIAALRQRGGAAPAASTVRTRAFAAAFAFSLLNPQTYLEMLLLVGGIALAFPPAERALFALGVALVSPLWFFGLVFGGRRLADLFARPRALWALDVATGFVMLVLATAIINGQLGRP
jgi:L-lysine exporter family protein LysE/ArgO